MTNLHEVRELDLLSDVGVARSAAVQKPVRGLVVASATGHLARSSARDWRRR
jgi:hypothetical protein